MWKTVLLLLLGIIVIPFLAFKFNEPLSDPQATLLQKLVLACLVTALLCFLVSSLSNNYSQVDKLWSIMPVIYAWIISSWSGFEPRLVLMAVLVTLWGIRLTYNFNRKGGYSARFWNGREDYRWAELRSRKEFRPRWKWILFNLIFISLYQMGLILLMTLPALKSMNGRPVSWADYILAGVFLLMVVIETIADQQQWEYHKKKNILSGKGEELPARYRKGFVDTGLWKYVRHPNYSAEQAIWIVFYFFSVAATGRWFNWSVMGPVLLVLLFWGSSNFSESISSRKYPEYAEYKKRVPRFIPSLFRKENPVISTIKSG
jgi:steroid 5-alpha reductase family enzyme